MNVPRLHSSPWVRVACLAAGASALALGLIGIFLPLLPTTPFILLAAACFARSSKRLHEALLAHRIAGPIIREWQTHRSMPPGIKPWAYLLLALSFGVSIWLVASAWHRALLAAIGVVLAILLWRVPVRSEARLPTRSS